MTLSTGQLAVLEALRGYNTAPNPARRSRKVCFTGWGLDPDVADYLAENPNAFLIGAVFDRGIVAVRAWEAPYLLSQRLGHLDVHVLARMTTGDLAEYIGNYNGEMALHRFTGQMADCIIAAATKLVNEYDGDAAMIWSGSPSAKEVVKRLDDFRGIGQKIAHMTVRLLVTYYGVHLRDLDAVDVAVDRHLARVFLRSGLVAGRRGVNEYPVLEITERAVEVARSFSPDYPALLDEPAFDIGRTWCRADLADCNGDEHGDEEPCPLSSACTRRRRSWGVL